jgi:hypothetical protein
MSTLDIKKLYDRAGTGSPNFTNGLNISGSDSGLLAFTHYNQADEPTTPANGDTWWDTTNNAYKVYVNGAWLTVLGAA